MAAKGSMESMRLPIALLVLDTQVRIKFIPLKNNPNVKLCLTAVCKKVHENGLYGVKLP